MCVDPCVKGATSCRSWSSSDGAFETYRLPFRSASSMSSFGSYRSRMGVGYESAAATFSIPKPEAWSPGRCDVAPSSRRTSATWPASSSGFSAVHPRGGARDRQRREARPRARAPVLADGAHQQGLASGRRQVDVRRAAREHGDTAGAIGGRDGGDVHREGCRTVISCHSRRRSRTPRRRAGRTPRPR